MLRIPFVEMRGFICWVLVCAGMAADNIQNCARLNIKSGPYGLSSRGFIRAESNSKDWVKVLTGPEIEKSKGLFRAFRGRLARMFDQFSAFLSEGLSTAGIDKAGLGQCGSCNRVFILFDPLKFSTNLHFKEIMDATTHQVKNVFPHEVTDKIFYPGEQSLKKRKENLELGIRADPLIWKSARQLAGIYN